MGLALGCLLAVDARGPVEAQPVRAEREAQVARPALRLLPPPSQPAARRAAQHHATHLRQG